MASARPSTACCTALLLLLPVITGCATTSGTPDAQALGEALSGPGIARCSDEVCAYRRLRGYALEDVDCRPGAFEGGLVCTYRRAEPGPPLRAPRWIPAKTELVWSQAGRWEVTQDFEP
jgi:hypothetical protein